jgi:uncharacterized delta-60 repeat protein
MPVRLTTIPLEDRATPATVGGLDSLFGVDGAVVPAVVLNQPDTTTPAAIGVQSDGRIIVGTTAFLAAGDTDFAVFRLNTDGSIDTTFGTGGLTTIPFDLGGTKADKLSALTVLPDDRIVAVGTAALAGTDTNMAVAVLTAAGKLDTTFNGTGKQTIAFDVGGTKADSAAAVAIDSQGRILVAGSAAQATAGDTDFAVARLTAAGKLDTTFNGTGKATVPFDLAGGTLEDDATGVGIGPGDSVVLVGNVFGVGTDIDAGVARFTSAGALDKTFDGDGSRVYGLDVAGTTKADTAVGVSVLSDGRIVFAGTVARTAAGATDFYAARVLSTGAPDTTFGGSGFVPAGFLFGGALQDTAAAITTDALGRVIIAGAVQISGADTDFGVVRFKANGTLDTSFDVDGGQQVPFDKGGTLADRATGLAFQPDGKILLAGPVALSTGAAVGVARVNGALGLSPTLGAGGPTTGRVSDFVLDSTNKYTPGDVLTPFPGYTGPVRTAVADFNGDGVPDTVAVIGPGGGSLVRVIDGASGTDLVPATQTYESAFTGGLFVAAADMDGDGRAEIAVSPDVGGGGRVQIFSVSNQTLVLKDNFFGIDDQSFRGGARVAIGDVNNDGRPELIVAAGFGGGPRVAIFDGTGLLKDESSPPKLIGDFFAFPGTDAVTLRNGVFVTAGDFNGDGYADLAFGGGPGGGPRVFVLSGQIIATQTVALAQVSPLANFFVAGDTSSRGGVRLTAKDIDDDNRADLIASSGDNEPSSVHVYLGTAFPATNGAEPAVWQTLDPFSQTLTNGVYVG